MQQRRNDQTQADRLEVLRELLSERLEFQIQPIAEQEKIKLKNAIQAIQYPYALKDILFYINQETANILADSAHLLLSGLGSKSKKFYTDDPLNKHIQPDTGIVVIRLGGITVKFNAFNINYYFTGQGVWDVSTKSWKHTPGSSATWNGNIAPPETVFGYVLNNQGYYPVNFVAINPPNLSDSCIQLISPMHIAALIGDEELIQYLVSKGGVEFPGDQEDLIDFLLEKELVGDMALQFIVKHGNFSRIEKLVNMNFPITDDVLDLALKRDSDLYDYLDLERRMDLQKRVDTGGAFHTLKNILNCSPVPMRSLLDLICIDAEIIHHVDNEANDNTLLYQLVTEKETAKVDNLLEAIFQASFKKIDGFNFDIDTKNKHGKTILDLALEQNNNDLTSAILLHNPKIDVTQQSLLVTAKIDIPAIHQKRDARLHTIIGQQNQTLEVQQKVLENTIVEVIATKEEIAQIKDINTQLVRQLEIQQQMLMQLCMAVGFEPVNPDQQIPRQPLLQYQVANQNMLFPTVKNNQNNVVIEHKEVRQPDNWPDLYIHGGYAK